MVVLTKFSKNQTESERQDRKAIENYTNFKNEKAIGFINVIVKHVNIYTHHPHTHKFVSSILFKIANSTLVIT